MKQKVKPTEFVATSKPNSKLPADPEAALARHYKNLYSNGSKPKKVLSRFTSNVLHYKNGPKLPEANTNMDTAPLYTSFSILTNPKNRYQGRKSSASVVH
jgi:hypothetical protein